MIIRRPRWLPDTLVGRTALVLVAALAGALAAALLTFADQRSEALAALGGRNAAERVASIANLLEETPVEARRQTLRSMDTSGFRAGWGVNPVVPDAGDWTGLAGSVARHLGMHLSGHEIRVSTRPPPEPPEPPPGWGMGQGGGPREHFHAMGGFGFVHGPALRISVRLSDNSWLNVVAPLDGDETMWQPRFLALLLSSLAAVTLAALWAVRRAARPFAGFAAAAERLGVDVAAPPLSETGPREIRLATHAFNVMQGRIRRFVEDRTQMLAAISHDLRTPITRMRLRAEFVEDEDERAKMLADLEEMEHMIAATLAFARDDATREERRPVDMAALVQGLAEDMGADYDGPDSLVMPAGPVALKRAFANLLDNARKYGGRARAALAEWNGDVVVTIDDDGPGIPESEFERVFAPFVRLEASRNRATGGTGLGLSIARAAVRAHGGDIVLANRPEGGLRVQVALPRPRG
ncbi:MAG TPA: ATP-binding protein [Magnetospirillum sp.]|jgi:signal transduction histidine kinase|nr:ATP-binding protein [Magnetospirillum sp.]